MNKKLVTFLKQLGLKTDQATVYLYLLEHGPSTVLQISRGLSTGRTKLYPALDTMAQKQVLAVHDRHYGTTYEALPPDNLEFLVSELERKADIARHNFKSSIFALSSLYKTSPTSSKILEYRGVDGMKQMNWNLSNKANGHYKVFELSALSKHSGMNAHFVAKLHQTESERNLTSHRLTNNPRRKIDLAQEVNNHFAYISPEVFTIEFETYIYNNVVALLSYEDKDVFGIEIYNEKLAKLQEKLFDLVWSQAKILK